MGFDIESVTKYNIITSTKSMFLHLFFAFGSFIHCQHCFAPYHTLNMLETIECKIQNGYICHVTTLLQSDWPHMNSYMETS